MTILNVQDFDDGTAFERFALAEARPLINRENSHGLTLDFRTGHLCIALQDSFSSMGWNAAIERFRPLLVGAALKVLDVMIELALNQSGSSPGNGRRWLIEEKANHAAQGTGHLLPLSSEPDVWLRIGRTYAALKEARHCLVHRKFEVGSNGEITNLCDSANAPVRDITSEEQEALFAVAQRAALGVLTGHLSGRERGDLYFRLDLLGNHHGMPNIGGVEVREIGLVIANARDNGNGKWEVDLASIRTNANTTAPGRHFDLELHFPESGHTPLGGELEDMPPSSEVIDPLQPPNWLRLIAP